MTFNQTTPHRMKRAIGTFPTRREAEQVLGELRDSGFPMDRVSVVAKNSDRDGEISGADMSNRVGNKADEGAKTGAVSGGAAGGLTGLLVGLGMLAIPGVGPVMLAGAGATALATALSGTAIGAVAGGLLGGLVGLGIPEADAKIYSDRVSRGDYLVMVDGTDEEVDRAGLILNGRGIEDWKIFSSDAQAVSAPVQTDRADRAVDSVQQGIVDRTPAAPLTDADSVRLYEERLLVDKKHQKTGEVVLGKHVETETARASVPLEKERVVIERVNVSDAGRAVAPGEASFQGDEVIQMEVYEETADFQKEAFVREEVNLRKTVERQVVNAEETIRREELDVTTEGHAIVDGNPANRPIDRA